MALQHTSTATFNSALLLTTNSISQVRQRGVVEFHLKHKKPLNLIFVIPDHPWSDDGAAVRIAMTVAEPEVPGVAKVCRIGRTEEEDCSETPEESAENVKIFWENVGHIFSDLKAGADITSAIQLKSNSELSSTGVKLHGAGFILDREEAISMGYGQTEGTKSINNRVIKIYKNGRDITGKDRDVFVIDFDDFSQEEASKYVEPFQRVLELVKPERDINRDKQRRENWWLFGRSNKQLRESLKGLHRYITTVETAKHRIFVFLGKDVIPDNKLIAIALSDAYSLGVLSSKVHVTWALAAGSRLEDRPVYAKTTCFDPFAFPDPTPEQKQKIRDLGERLDAHRKKVQADHPDITITGMYNLLEKLRAGEPFTDKDRDYNDRALVSTLKQIHDELDLAVLDAYGWPHDITDEQILENLVALNAQRAEEERNGYVRWLRPEYQAPDEVQPTQQVIAGVAEPEETVIAPVEQQTFPSSFKDQLAAIRDLMRTQGGEWTVAQVKAQFKNASRKQRAIQDCLDCLTDLGAIACHTEDATPRWYIADLQKAA